MLTRQKRFLKCAAQAGLYCAAEKGAEWLQLDFFYNWSVKTWEYYQHSSREVRIAELEEITPCTPQQIQGEVAHLVAEHAAGAPPDVQSQIIDLVCQLPGSVRRGLRRPEDPRGITVPPSLRLESPADLLKLMPQKVSRFKPGDRIPGIPWQLLEKLGDGGFGEVWKAHNPKYPGLPPVALKFCLDDAAAGSIEHEARVIDRVMRQAQHPGIVALRQVYESDPPCLEYEYVGGGELTKLIEDWGPAREVAGFRRAARVVQRLAAVVGFAHRLAEPIVHRDLKPANILVTRSDDGKYNFKIADFGIGGVAATLANQNPAANDRATQLAQHRGSFTPIYSSPQQRRGAPADVRDDVHALGVIWYQLVVGDPTAELLTGDVWKEKLLSRGMPAAELKLLITCVEHDPIHRPADAAFLADRLRQLLEPASPTPPQPMVGYFHGPTPPQPTPPPSKPDVSNLPKPLPVAAEPVLIQTRTADATLDRIRSKFAGSGAKNIDLRVMSAIYRCGQELGAVTPGTAKTASFVIHIPTCAAKVALLTVQGTHLRFYWGHFVGGYDETQRANFSRKKFPHAYELAEEYCQRLNTEFGWDLSVKNGKGGFAEPSRPLSDLADSRDLERFLEILKQVAAAALQPPARQPMKEPVKPAPSNLVFRRWRKTPGVIDGPSQTKRVGLKFVGLVLNEAEIELLSPLRFWLITPGTRTHTFGFLRADLPPELIAPFHHWIEEAQDEFQNQRADWVEVRQAHDGDVVRVNVPASAVEIEEMQNPYDFG